MSTLPWLLKREYWEHRGGFLWAPLWTAAAIVVLTLMGLITTEVFKIKFTGDVNIGISLRYLISRLSSEDLAQAGPAIDLGLLSLGGVIQTVLFFVLFFYLLGTLYDDRRDRSVLFWKSLPISDAATVASKALTAAFVAPLLAFAATVLLQLTILVLASAYLLLHGINPLTVIWGPASPLSVWARMLAAIPLNALWALPTIGWLLLVSAFARSKPFLWALVVPIATGLMINWFDLLSTFSIPDSRYWTIVASRLLLGIAANSYQLLGVIKNPANVSMSFDDKGLKFNGTNPALDWDAAGSLLASPHLWIGAVAGIAMLYGAVYFRRRRDDN